MKPQIFAETILVWLGPVPITRTMATSALTSILLICVFGLLARAVVGKPSSRLAAAGRLTFHFLEQLVTESVGERSPQLEAFAGSLFLFICGATIVGQFPGIPAPTANLPATSALAALVFFAIPVQGIRANGVVGYLKHYFRPHPLLFPLHVITELSRGLALALRLFGNMLSGHLTVALVVAIVGVFVPVPLMALAVFIGFLQAYIFTVLTCVYIGAATRIAEESQNE